MQKVNIFEPNSALAAMLSDRDATQYYNYDPRWFGAMILANLSALVGLQGAILAPVSVVFSTDTSAYAAGDLLADTQPIAGALRIAGGVSKLVGLTLVDKDNNTAAGIDVVFLKSNKSLGTENAAPSISDADSIEIIHTVSLVAGDFVQVGTNFKMATKFLAVPQPVYATAGTTVYVALIARGTPTQTASGLVGNFFFRQE